MHGETLKFAKIRSVEAEFFNADGQADGQIRRHQWSLSKVLQKCLKTGTIMFKE